MNQLDPKMSWGSMPIGSGGGGKGAGLLGDIGLGAMIGGPVGVAAGALHAVHRFASDIPRVVKTLASLERMAQGINRTIDAGAAVLVKGGEKAAVVGRSEAAASAARTVGYTSEGAQVIYLKRVANLKDLTGNPEQMHETLTKQTEGMHDHAPNTASAVQMSSARAVAFLASKLPQIPDRGPLAPEWKPSSAEVAKFNRYYNAVEKPTDILKQAAAGTLSAEAVEAVRTVYPQLFQKMQTSIMEKMAGNKGAIPYKSRLMLGLMFGKDLDGSLSSASILRNQATLAGPSSKGSEASGPVKPTASGASKITLSTRMQTPMEKAAARGD
jgi:hypothetical protein